MIQRRGRPSLGDGGDDRAVLRDGEQLEQRRRGDTASARGDDE
jgi:hypothetical protein